MGATGPTGATGPIGPTGPQGWTGPEANTDLIRNIGLNAYILDADLAGTYAGSTGIVTYVITLYGNSSYYNLTFSYVGSGTAPASHSTFRTSTTNYNNIYATGPQPQSVTSHNTFNYPFQFPSAPAADTYTVTMTVSTANARGSGVGSTYSKTMSLVIGASDDMGSPTITLPLSSTPSLSTGNLVRISGINYYTSTTTLTFGARSLELSNIYNILPSNPPPDFNYITISDSASSTPTTHNTFSLQFGASPYTGYNLSPTNSKNTKYYNAAAFSHTLTGNNLSGSIATALRLDYFLLNAKNARTPASSVNTLYPTAPTLIGYVHNSWTTSKETGIPKNQGGTTIAAVTTQTRMSVPTSETVNPLQPVTLSTFSSTGMTDYDPAYNPFDGILYASGFTSSLSNYIIPGSQPFTFNNATRKYLAINLVVTNIVKTFTLEFQCSNSLADIDVSVKWVGSGWGQQVWYNAKINSTSAGVGASAASPTKTGNTVTVPIRININDDSVNPSSDGNIYLIIGFTGNITTNKILIRNT